MSDYTNADYAIDYGGVTICATDMREASRESVGIKWCFVCRKRHEFWWVVSIPNGISYYGPSARMEGNGRYCSDLFPGWYREAPDV